MFSLGYFILLPSLLNCGIMRIYKAFPSFIFLVLLYQPITSQFIEDWWIGGTPQWVSCDYNTQAGMSCHNCTAILQCFKNGGLLYDCRNAWRPYCNAGYCSYDLPDDCEEELHKV